jgi:two-component system sensor histidine kinase CiaH
MIYRLRRKFIWICMISYTVVFLAIFSVIYIVNYCQNTISLDRLTDTISENGGQFPDKQPDTDINSDQLDQTSFELNPEIRFTTRFFTAYFDQSGNELSLNTKSIASITEDQALSYAESVINGADRGWLNNFRYKVFTTSDGKAVVFIDARMMNDSAHKLFLTAFAVLAGGGLIVLLMVILISKKAVRPVSKSYDKQKEFITDVNHELRTPLTLIMTNLDIAETEIGMNEWLDDIRDESRKMNGLVDRLITLERMDGTQAELQRSVFSLSDAVLDNISSVLKLAKIKSEKVESDVDESVYINANEESIRQLISILIENAVKYCDKNGTITVSLKGKKHPVFKVENSYSGAEDLELDRLFDRFYRADKARTYGQGFGIGLSIAKAITENNHGEISARCINGETICFTVKL